MTEKFFSNNFFGETELSGSRKCLRLFRVCVLNDDVAKRQKICKWARVKCVFWLWTLFFSKILECVSYTKPKSTSLSFDRRRNRGKKIAPGKHH